MIICRSLTLKGFKDFQGNEMVMILIVASSSQVRSPDTTEKGTNDPDCSV